MIYGIEYEELLRPGFQIESKAGGSPGTLGCFARIVSGQDAGKIVLLSNRHVLYGVTDLGMDGSNADVGQPSVGCCWCCACRVIANNRGNGQDGFNDVIVDIQGASYSLSERRGSEFDAAVAILNDERPYTNAAEFEGTERMLSGTQSVVAAEEPVWKVGASSGPTSGTILGLTNRATYADSGQPVGANLFPLAGASSAPLVDTKADINHYLVVPEAGRAHFARPGDSGSIVANANNEVIGLFSALVPLNQGWRDLLAEFSATPIHGAAQTLAIVHPIGPILTALGIAIDADMQTSTTPTAGLSVAVPDDVAWGRGSEASHLQVALKDLEREFRRSRLGALLVDAMERHRREIGGSAEHQRAVTLAWRRGRGPAYMAHFLRSVRDRDYEIPLEIHGITPVDLVRRLLAALEIHGDRALRDDLARYGPLVVEWAGECRSAWQIVERLRRRDDVR